MSNARLTKTHELNLLQKLSTDDGYRARFEQDPAAALKEIGVSDTDISSLDPASLKPGNLAAKADIANAHNLLSEDNLKGHACMVFPFLRVDYGDSSRSNPS